MARLVVTALAAIVGVIWLLYPLFGPDVEAQRARGPLTEALLAAADDPAHGNNMTAVYGKFIEPAMSLQDRAKLLRANGFGCKVEPAGVRRKVALQLRCIRTVEGSWGCKGFNYFSFQTTDDGKLHETGGRLFSVAEGSRVDGRCNANLEAQAELERS